MSSPDFWANQEQARQVVAELKAIRSITKPLEGALQAADDLVAMIEIAEDDEQFAAEVPGELHRLEQLVDQLQVKALLGGPFDGNNAIVTINARDGGTDAADWAEMLLRMYISWAKQHEYDVEMLDRQDNEEAGIASASVAIRGPLAYGYLKGESGIHRLIRISPFNAEGKRQTSFAAVDVSPEVPESIDIDVDWDRQVREDVFRSSGAGGQHVNKTSSAIRLTHLPTGITVQCQNERSQHKNRAMARRMLLARLARLEEERREAELAAKYTQMPKVGFGSQIRSYFQHPEQRVKDGRSGFTVNNFHAVMDGEIQGFLEAYLRWKVARETAARSPSQN